MTDELRTDADAGVDFAAEALTETLADQGKLEEFRREVDAGTRYAANQMVTLLRKQGRIWDAERLHMYGLAPDGTIAHRDTARSSRHQERSLIQLPRQSNG